MKFLKQLFCKHYWIYKGIPPKTGMAYWPIKCFKCGKERMIFMDRSAQMKTEQVTITQHE